MSIKNDQDENSCFIVDVQDSDDNEYLATSQGKIQVLPSFNI